MQLVQSELTDRGFHIQFADVMREFGTVIPWLDPLRKVEFSTNPDYFRDKVLKGLRCRDESDITPLQLVTSDERREYVGGIIRLAHSPEKFVDSRNQELFERFSTQGYQFISCLQIRKDLRGGRLGPALMRDACDLFLKVYGKFWGVVSDFRLIQYYISIGAHLDSPLDNADRLWIVSWQRPTEPV